jgi:hypothetical protein
VEILYEMLSIFTVKTINDCSFLRDYYLRHIPVGKFTTERKKRIVKAFLDFFISQAKVDHKVQEHFNRCWYYTHSQRKMFAFEREHNQQKGNNNNIQIILFWNL